MTSKKIKLLNHPEREQIISRLISGESVREISAWLDRKYPDNTEYHISHTTLNLFRKNELNIQGAVLDKVKSRMMQVGEEDEKRLSIAVESNVTYREKINEFVDMQIDWRKKLIGILNIIETRVEQIFDSIQLDPGNYKPDYVLLQWMDKVLHFVQEIRKIEGAPDQIVQHNVTVQAIDERTAIFQEAIQEVAAEVDLRLASLFIEKVNSKLESMSFSDKLLYTKYDADKLEILEAVVIPEKLKDYNGNDE